MTPPPEPPISARDKLMNNLQNSIDPRRVYNVNMRPGSDVSVGQVRNWLTFCDPLGDKVFDGNPSVLMNHARSFIEGDKTLKMTGNTLLSILLQANEQQRTYFYWSAAK